MLDSRVRKQARKQATTGGDGRQTDRLVAGARPGGLSGGDSEGFSGGCGGCQAPKVGPHEAPTYSLRLPACTPSSERPEGLCLLPFATLG